VPGHSRPGRSHGRDLGQHFLESAALAATLTREAGIGRSDHVVEFGAGTGALTAALVDRGAHVLAVEIDPSLVARLVARFRDVSAVTVFEQDALTFPFPSTPFRVFANPPFNRTAAILHRLLDDPASGLARADLVVQWQVARAREHSGERHPIDLVGAAWGPWWAFRRGRRLPAKLFRPPPSVDAALLTVTRRHPALLPVEVAREFTEFVRDRFGATTPLARVEDWVRHFSDSC
jgi:23S rRNA (adenine-N6)-dimethyltransferase